MSILYRPLLIALSIAFLAAAYASYTHTTEVTVAKETFHYIKWNWVQPTHFFSLLGILIWCFLFVRRDPLFVRIGLATIFAASILPFLKH